MCLPYIHGIFRHRFHFLMQGSLCARAKETAFNCHVAAVSDHVMRITPWGTKTFETVDGTWMWPEKKHGLAEETSCYLPSVCQQLCSCPDPKKRAEQFRPHWGGLNSSVAQRGKTEGEEDGIRLDWIGMPTLIGLARIATKMKFYPWDVFFQY